MDAWWYLLQWAAGVFGLLTERHRPLPHHRTMTFEELMSWLGETQHALEREEAARAWDRRDVVCSLGNGWTVQRLTTPRSAARGDADA
jgi:hypothetical protein